VSRVRSTVLEEWPPGLKLFDVLQHDHARANILRPTHDDPRKPADVLRHRLAALGLAKVLAVGREPRQSNRLAACHLNRIDAEDVFAVVLRRRVIRGVHRDSFGIVVDRDVN
jgi:hypothetical protein